MEEIDLHGSECLHVDLRERFFNVAHHAHVIFPRPIGMQAAGDVDLVNIGIEFSDDLLDSHLIRFGRILLHREIAEFAGEDADIRRFYFLIHDIIDRIAALHLLHGMGHFADGNDILRSKHCQSVLQRKPLPALHFIPNRM